MHLCKEIEGVSYIISPIATFLSLSRRKNMIFM